MGLQHLFIIKDISGQLNWGQKYLGLKNTIQIEMCVKILMNYTKLLEILIPYFLFMKTNCFLVNCVNQNLLKLVQNLTNLVSYLKKNGKK